MTFIRISYSIINRYSELTARDGILFKPLFFYCCVRFFFNAKSFRFICVFELRQIVYWS